MRGPLTREQVELIKGVKRYQDRYGPGPTLTLLMREVAPPGTSLNDVLPRLIATGWLSIEDDCAGRFVLTAKATAWLARST